MSNRINVNGIDPWELLAALHNNAKVPRTAVCMVQARGDVTADEAREESQSGVREDYQMHQGVPFWPDYLFGRPIKAFLVRDGDDVFLSRTDLYDRSAGEGTAARIVCRLVSGEVAVKTAEIRTKQEEVQALLLELEQAAKLKAMGIIRHDIVKQRHVTKYRGGRHEPTGMADIIMRDGTQHFVPADLLKWKT